MRSKGSTLVELLVVISIFSYIGIGVGKGLIRSAEIRAAIEKQQVSNRPLHLLRLQLRKDLRNMLDLKDYPFSGNEAEMTFPSVVSVHGKEGEENISIKEVRYYVEDRHLIREETGLVSGGTQRRNLLKRGEDISFSFPYRADEEEIIFQKYWLEDPYLGLPRAVRIHFEGGRGDTQDEGFVVSVPQGVMGTLAYSDS